MDDTAIISQLYATKNLFEASEYQRALKMVKHDGMDLEFVPDMHFTEELFKAAVERSPLALKWVPEHQRTPELCRIAVEWDGMALASVPEHLRTDELYKLSVLSEPNALGIVPLNRRTPELCLKATRMDVYALQFVPTSFRKTLQSIIEREGQNNRHPREPDALTTYDAQPTSFEPVPEPPGLLDDNYVPARPRG